MTTPPRFPLAKRSLDSLGLRRRHDPPPPQFFRPELRARASSSSALAQRAGSMRFATAIPESYIKMTRKPPKNRKNKNKNKNKKKGGRSKKATNEYLPLSKRWALAAANAFRPSRKSNAKQIQSKKFRRVVNNADMAPKNTRQVEARPFTTPPERNSSLRARTKTRPTPIINEKPPLEKPLPSTPKPEVLDTLHTREAPGSLNSTIETTGAPALHDKVGRPEVSERWPDLSPWKPPRACESNYRGVEVEKAPQQPSSQSNDRAASPIPTTGPPPLPPSTPLTPPRSSLRHSRLRITSNWAANSSHLDTIFQAAEPNDPMEKKMKTTIEPPELNSESKRANLPVRKDDNVTFKPNPFRNRYRTVSTPENSSQAQSQNDLNKFSFEFGPDSPKAGFTNSRNQPCGDVLGRSQASNSYITPRHESAPSKIPRISPQMLTPLTPGEAADHWNGSKKVRSPSRRSSIPIPSRMVHKKDKFDASALPASQALKTGHNIDSFTASTIYEEEAFRDQKDFGSQNNRHIVDMSDMSHTKPHGNESNPPMTLPDGYISKDLATAGRSGPQLRISPEADKVIMGNMTDALEDSSQNYTGKRAKRVSGSKRLSGDSIFGSFTPKYLLHSQSNSSLNPSTHSPTEGKVAITKEKKLKKARSTDAAYVNMSTKQHAKNFGTNPFYNDGIAGSVPSPGMFNERYPFSNSGSSDTHRYSETEATSQGYKALPSSPLAESTNLIDDNDVICSHSGSQINHVGLSLLDPPVSVDQPHKKNEKESSNDCDPSSTVRHRSSSQRLLPRSSRHRMTEHGNHGKSKLNNVDAPNGLTDVAQNDGIEVPRRKHRDISTKHHSLSTTREHSRIKESFTTKGSGVLSNFRGLFTKQKTDSTTAGVSTQGNMYASSSITAKRKYLERVKAANSGKVSTGSPMERSFSRRARGSSRAENRGEDKLITPSREAGGDRSRPASDSLTINSQMADSPALSGIRNVSVLCMHVLDTARDEPNGSKKEKLIKLGKMLVETVNYSNDAERAMLAAMQAAKEAEIACALAKENAMRMAQVAQDWISNYSNNSNTSLY
ncbi:hypothetical protein ACJ72_00897 [Emergomyces africanus]|uniref:Uncharacterized protein n=1 Tax=Emergomyces africanus TaxID=1955775 RepID=A0A1B7P6U7_9EURO|nr:hypothetical protein ACJ72_00897 [Emergomyces africanus]